MSRTLQGAPSAHSQQGLKRRQRCVAAAMALLHVLPMTLPLAAHAQQALPAPVPAGTTVLNYDAQGNLKQTIDPYRRNATTYVRKGLGDYTQNSPDTGATAMEFDELGAPSYQLNARQGDASFQYDALNRLEIVYNPNGYKTRFLYDNYSTTTGSENYGRGRLTQIVEYRTTSIQSRVMMFYDQQGRVSKRCQIWGISGTCGPADALAYRWGPTSGVNAGRLLGLTYPTGRKVDYQYDALGRISGITTTDPCTPPATTCSNPVVQVLRDAQYTPLAVEQGGYGLTGFNFGPASSTQSYVREYDTQGRIDTFTLGKGLIANVTVGLHTLEYDDVSRVKAINRFTSAWSTATYAYDDLDRLTDMSLNGGSLFSYSYDINGNRTLKTAYSAGTAYVYPSTNNRLSSTQTGSTASTAVTTDPTGNITNDPVTLAGAVTFLYEDIMGMPYGRLTAATGAAGRYDYQYNYLGQRIAKRGVPYNSGTTTIAPVPYLGSNATLFHYDLQGHLIAELDETTRQVKREYIWLGDQPVAVIAGSTPTLMVSSSNAPAVYYIHADHLNTPRLVTDAQKAKRWDWGVVNNEPFGATVPSEAPAKQVAAQQFTLNLRMPGQYMDKESGTFYNYYRNYNPQTGRYLQSDPIGLNGGLNTYSYVTGNPLSYTDPLGLMGGGNHYCPCPKMPPKPPGESVCKNMEKSDDHWDPEWFKKQVQNKGPWDYKQKGPQYQDFGNFNYGATGQAFGFPDQVLYRMAGWAQVQAGTSRSEWGNPNGSSPYGDDPRDQDMIRKGIEFARCGCKE